MSATAQEIFERHVRANMTRDTDALADLFATDGVFEAPLIPAGAAFPRRMEGREEIRRELKAYQQRSVGIDRKVNVSESRYVLHTTADPDVFIAEIDTAIDVAGEAMTMSLVRIYRIHDGQITLLRDYFAPEHAD
jgi:ketosteroid isomerase-like protein